MNLSRYFAVKKTGEPDAGAENPFRWAESVGDSTVGSGEDLDRNIFDEGEAFEVEIAHVEPLESSDPKLGDISQKSEKAWLHGVEDSDSGADTSQEDRGLGDIVVKRNDLWESDWEVRVAESKAVGIEVEASPVRRASGFGQWIRGVLGIRSGGGRP